MKKNLFLIGLILAVCIGFLMNHICSLPLGKTVQSREKILNNSISKGKGWTIAKELKLDDCIISGAYSTDNKAALAVFMPTKIGNYRFITSTNRDHDDIILSGAMINGEWYDFIWFQGAQTEYAEITYSINGQVQNTMRYDTEDMEIISIKNPEKEYTIQAVYYDSAGNKYE